MFLCVLALGLLDVKEVSMLSGSGDGGLTEAEENSDSQCLGRALTKYFSFRFSKTRLL